MKSTIRIDIDFETNEPIIEIVCDRSSNDLRDKMLSQFLQSFGGDSSWAKFNYDRFHDQVGIQRAYLRPITRGTFPQEGKAMLEQHQLNVNHNVPGTPVTTSQE